MSELMDPAGFSEPLRTKGVHCDKGCTRGIVREALLCVTDKINTSMTLLTVP